MFWLHFIVLSLNHFHSLKSESLYPQTLFGKLAHFFPICFDLLWKDVEAPKFPNGCPYNQKMYSGPLESPVAVNWSDPDVTDNSASSVTLTSDVIKGTLLDPGFHIIRITASDLAGNKVSCNFVVTVEGALNRNISHRNVLLRVSVDYNISIAS